jgi:hypothetical protein
MIRVALLPLHSDDGYSVRVLDDEDGTELFGPETLGWSDCLDVSLYDARGALDSDEVEVNLLEVEEI